MNSAVGSDVRSSFAIYRNFELERAKTGREFEDFEKVLISDSYSWQIEM